MENNDFLKNISEGVAGLVDLLQEKKKAALDSLPEEERLKVEDQFKHIDIDKKVKEMQATFAQLAKSLKK